MDVWDKTKGLSLACQVRNNRCWVSSLFLCRLSFCGITETGCTFLASALRTNPSHLRELDLSFNHPGESGVKLLSELLQDPACRMEKLKLVSRSSSWLYFQWHALRLSQEVLTPNFKKNSPIQKSVNSLGVKTEQLINAHSESIYSIWRFRKIPCHVNKKNPVHCSVRVSLHLLCWAFQFGPHKNCWCERCLWPLDHPRTKTPLIPSES